MHPPERINTNHNVDSVVATVSSNGVIRSSINTHLIAWRRLQITSKPLTQEIVALIGCRPLLIERRPETRQRVAPDALKRLKRVRLRPQRFAPLVDCRKLDDGPLVSASGLLCEEATCEIVLVHAVIDQHDRAAGLQA